MVLKKYIKPAVFIFLGIMLGFPVVSMSYYTMWRTSTPEFCSSCHEIEPAYRAWKTSSHVNNQRGFVADCMDCHLPAPEDTVNFFYAKTAHGIKDVFIHLFGGEYDRAKARENAYKSIKNEQCMKCHRNLMYISRKRGAMLAHRTVLYPMPGYEKKCFDCHRNLVHVDRNLYQ